MFTEQEIERINKGENIVVTIDKDCSAGYRFRDGCDIMIVTSPFSSCKIDILNHHFTAHVRNGLEIAEISDNTNEVIAYKYRLMTYKLFYYAHSDLIKRKFFYRPGLTPPAANFKIKCTKHRLLSVGQASPDLYLKRFSIVTTYCT